MYSNKLFGVPYVWTLLIVSVYIKSIHSLNYQQSRRFNTGQKFVPNPMYQDMDYDNNQYQEEYVGAASQNDPINSWSLAQHPQYNVNAAINKLSYSPVLVSDWPSPSVKLGQVSAVCVDSVGSRVFVFHRATREWDGGSFTADDRYAHSHEPPILQPTIVVLNATTGEMIEQWGENLFYLPHGLTVDNKNNVWVTDVALHQVMKFTPGNKESPSLTLGVRFVPGNDNYHFCKPTAVAVMESGEFFVSDGYCNSRIIKYSPEGLKLLQWGRRPYPGMAQVFPHRYSFLIPHALALAEDLGLLCVADREHGRVECFNCITGTFVSTYHSQILGDKIYSVAYSPIKGGQLYIVNGADGDPFGANKPIRGFVLDMNTTKILSQFGPDNNDFTRPHDIAVSRDGRDVYVVELNPYRVYKFVDPTLVVESATQDTKIVSENPTQLTNVNTTTKKTTTIAPAKPTATIEGLAMSGSSWAGWAGVAGGVAGGLAAVLMLLVGGAILLARARHHRGCLSPLTPRNRRQRWDYAPGAPDFKLRHFLERQRAGFERVNTDESDEEPTPATSMLAPQNA